MVSIEVFVRIPLQLNHRFRSNRATHSDRKPATRFTESRHTARKMPDLKATTGLEHQNGGSWGRTCSHEQGAVSASLRTWKDALEA